MTRASTFALSKMKVVGSSEFSASLDGMYIYIYYTVTYIIYIYIL